MKNLILILCLFISGSAISQSIIGKWKTIDDETGKAKSIVKIYEQNGQIYGKIIELFRTPEEEQNPICEECKGDKNGQKINGMVIIEGLIKDGDEYEDGTILDPKSGKVYDCKIWLENDNKLMVRGYVGIFFRTQEWIRVVD
jgi:uncharacterized protein (DUF2147 family)